ncbi:Transposon Ty3-I Gag-Pol polyprotein, partial [Aduncisulcus paluster]
MLGRNQHLVKTSGNLALSSLVVATKIRVKHIIDTGWRWKGNKPQQQSSNNRDRTHKGKKTSSKPLHSSDPSDPKPCPFCHKMGHTLEQCWSYKKQQRLKKISSGTTTARRPITLGASKEDGFVHFSALIDTGASANFITPEALARIPHAKDLIKPCHVVVSHGEDAKSVVNQQITFVDQVIGDDDVIIGGPWSQNFDIVTIAIDETREENSDSYPEEIARRSETCNFSDMIDQTSEIRDEIAEILKNHAVIFDTKLPRDGSKLDKFRVDLIDPDKTWSCKPKRLCPAHQAVLSERIRDDLKDGIIERSSSSNVCSPVFVPKRDGGTRMCINFVPLNRNTVPLPFPIPNVEEVLSNVANCKVFGSTDLVSGFHQIRVEDESKPLLAFTCSKGLFQYRRMPFGTMNASAHFQRSIEKAFADLTPHACLIFIDDLLIKGETNDEFLTNLEAVLSRVEELNLRLKPSKCKFGVSEVEFLGREVSDKGIRIADSRISDLKDLQPPKSKKQVQQALGLFNYYRSFVRNFADIVAPLRDLTKKMVKFSWSDQCQKAFEMVKEAILKKTLMFHIDYKKELFLQTDASDNGIGGVLFQVSETSRETEPIFFVSKRLSPVEKRWPTGEQEAYAIKYCVERMEHFLRGAHFTLQTDHANLRFMSNSKSPKVQRWNSFLADFSFDVVHIPGKDNVVADALSRVGMSVTLKRIIIDDSVFKDIFKSQESLLSEDEKAAYKYDDGYYRDGQYRIVIPALDEDLHKRIFKTFHSAVSGHHGSSQTQFKIQSNGLSWASIAKDCKNWVASCITCQKLRSAIPKRKPSFTTEREEPFHTICIDTMGPLPPSVNGNKYILVAVDAFTRWVEIVPCKSAEKWEVVNFLVNDIISRFGVPREIISDQGRQYANYLSDHLFDTFGIVHHRTTSDHPEANGRVERVNREVKRHLMGFVSELIEKDEWDSCLPLVQNIINHTPHSAIGCSPSEMLFGGRKSRSVIVDWQNSRETSLSELPEAHKHVDEYVKQLT